MPSQLNYYWYQKYYQWQQYKYYQWQQYINYQWRVYYHQLLHLYYNIMHDMCNINDELPSFEELECVLNVTKVINFLEL